MRDASPLRYPGGKWRLASFFKRLIALNFQAPPTYVEPYAGGASLALSLLFSESVREIFLNDLDPAVHAFWHSSLYASEQLCDLIARTPITLAEWERQRTVHRRCDTGDKVALGFATFFLNRTNHSGILNAGIIGGKGQGGRWKMDARFNRPALVARVARVARYQDRIHLSNEDAARFVRRHSRGTRKLMYLDPPYFGSGKHLYMNDYDVDDHKALLQRVSGLRCLWVVSYDDIGEVRTLYQGVGRSRRITLLHTARNARVGREVMFFAPTMRIPRMTSMPPAALG